jgi:DNA-directed RNA polymerase sigma subunit (sigma70/sigma32)
MHRYLLDRSHTLEETGRTFHITREMAHQYEQRGLRKMGHPQSAKLLRSLLQQAVLPSHALRKEAHNT